MRKPSIQTNGNWKSRSNWVVIHVLDDAVSIKVGPEENLESDDNFIYLFINYIQLDTCCGKLSTMEDSIVFPFAEHSLSTHDPLM